MQSEPANISNQTVELGALLEASPVPFSMNTIGWKMLFGMLALLCLVLLYKYYKSYKNNAYRREAVLHVKQLANAHQSNPVSLISETMFQLKQTALQSYSRSEVASLKGAEWLRFLDEKGKITHFLKDEIIITQALYKNELDTTGQFSSSAFINSSIKWIKTHA